MLSLYSTTNHANVSEQAADSAEDDWIMMNNRLPAVTLRLLVNCILRKRIQMYGKTNLQHTQLNVDRIMMNDGPEAVLQSPLSTLVSASVRDPSALDCTKTTNFQNFWGQFALHPKAEVNPKNSLYRDF